MSPATMSEPGTVPVAASATRKAAMWIAAVFVLAAALGSVSGYMYGHRAPGPPLSDDKALKWNGNESEKLTE